VVDGTARPAPGHRRTHRGALIGFGGVARNAHLPGFRHDPSVRARLAVVVAVDPAPGAAEGADIPVLSDRSELPAWGPIDFVDICTPTGSHFSTTLWALEHGYHVLCEKPVATSRADADRIVAAAKRARRVVVPCHQYRHNPAWRQMVDWLRSGEIGHWHLAELSVYRPAADAGADRGVKPWRTVASESAGGILLDHGTHLLYSLLDAAGTDPTAVRAWTGRLRHHDYGVEDTAHLVLEFPDRLATVLLTWAAAHRENRVRFIGERGTIDWQGGVLRLERAGHAPEDHDFTVQLDKQSYPSWFAALFDSFADALDRGDAPEALNDVVRVARVLEAAYAAARSGGRVSLDRP
jgi:UDP-N-acetylglucosamine 3-dehydrogenase